MTDIAETLEKYDKKKIRIATIGSHSALNIFKGAKELGFETVCICSKGHEELYQRYNLVDEVVFIEGVPGILDDKVQERLKDLNAVVIPHGSFTAYLEPKKLENEFRIPMFGGRTLLRWEASRELQMKWLKKAGLHVPKVYDSINDIDGLAFVKFPGARGGKGYFIVDSSKAYHEKMADMIKRGLVTKEVAKSPYIQEYIVGVSTYPHYFYSPLNDKIELMGIDKRYESSVDGIDRIPVPEQLEQKINPSFTIVGNFPMVVRESMLFEIFRMGEAIVDESKKIAPPGIIGPFCLETIVKDDLKMITFEISARIVAGCNVNIGMSPYTYLAYDEPMYMGKRIAKEIKDAIKQKRLGEVIT